MNLFELGGFLVMISAVILCSRGLERVAAIPEALAVPLIIGILASLLRVFTRIRPRSLLFLSTFSAAVCLLSMWLAKSLGLRESMFMIPLSATLILLLVRGVLLARSRSKGTHPNADTQKS